ncbi:MAG TPA: adenylate/guanylate cyclase domain-containing protein [Solirubrobacteraceae bacterium]
MSFSNPDWLAPDPADKARLVQYLSAAGADAEELREADAAGTLGPLGLELALRPGGERIPFDEAASRAGLEPDEAAELWRALGLPDPLISPPSLTEPQIDQLRILGEMRNALGEETTLQLARVIGGSVALIAEALVDAFRVNVEVPRRGAGEPYSKLVEDFARVGAVVIPALGQVITDVLGSHLVAVSRSTWGLDAERATVTRELTIGFADLVDYTPSTRRLAPADLAATITRFERHVADVVRRFDGRVVKMIGDEAMFIAGDPETGCELALALRRRLAEDPELPSVLIGLAAGPVVSHRGDYYGDVVNLAARLVKVAAADEVLVSESIAEADAGSRERFELTGAAPLKGYDDRVGAYRLESPPL